MSDLLKDKVQKQEKKLGKAHADGTRGKEKAGRTKELATTAFGYEEQGNPEDPTAAQVANSHPLGWNFPVLTRTGTHRMDNPEHPLYETTMQQQSVFIQRLLQFRCNTDCYRRAFLITISVNKNSLKNRPDKQFPISAVSYIMEEEINNNLQEEKYEAKRCRELTLTLCEGIRNRVKELLIPRYKLVVLVHIAQLNGQGMQISSRCLWDTSSDTFTSYSFKNSSLFCISTVYGVYFE